MKGKKIKGHVEPFLEDKINEITFFLVHNYLELQ